MEELKLDVGLMESFTKKSVWSRLKWTGQVERMGDEKLGKSAYPESGGKEGREEHQDGKEWEENNSNRLKELQKKVMKENRKKKLTKTETSHLMMDAKGRPLEPSTLRQHSQSITVMKMLTVVVNV